MSQITLDVSLDQLRELVRQLPPAELVALANEIEDQAETATLMKLAESGFAEWNAAGEDLYDDQARPH